VSIEIVKPGLLTTLQDAGRPGWAHLGIGRAGAFDAAALRIGNALCGNPRDACGLEITLLGPTLHFRDAAWIAVTGAAMPVRIDGIERPCWAPLFVPAGSTLEFGAIRDGCRSWLAVRGGFAVAAVLGSRSMDVNAQLGPFSGRPLRAGDVLPVDCDPRLPAVEARSTWRLDPRPWFPGDLSQPLRLLPGHHLDRLTKSARKQLFSVDFKVDTDSNRVALRLTGPTLDWASPVEMVSEGCVPGLLQLPPSGQPIAFGPEGPVSGGYPRIGQVAAVDVPRLAQAKPGDAVRFMPCTLEDALRAFERRERALTRLEANIAARWST
jgi:antagonist of KipI